MIKLKMGRRRHCCELPEQNEDSMQWLHPKKEGRIHYRKRHGANITNPDQKKERK